MAYDVNDAAVLLEDLGGTLRPATGGDDLPALLTEGDVFGQDGQGAVKLGTATIKIVTGSLELVRQMLVRYREEEEDEWRTFRVRDWQRVGGGTFTNLIVVDEGA